MNATTKQAKQLHEYLLYRTGSNSANQSCTFEPVPIAIVKASSREDAQESTWGDQEPTIHGCPTVAAQVVASCGNLDVWSNQTLHAVPRSKAKKSDWDAVLELDQERQVAGMDEYGYSPEDDQYGQWEASE